MAHHPVSLYCRSALEPGAPLRQPSNTSEAGVQTCWTILSTPGCRPFWNSLAGQETKSREIKGPPLTLSADVAPTPVGHYCPCAHGIETIGYYASPLLRNIFSSCEV